MSTELGAAELPGLDVPRVTGWLTAAVTELEAPLRFTRIGGGLSAIS